MRSGVFVGPGNEEEVAAGHARTLSDKEKQLGPRRDASAGSDYISRRTRPLNFYASAHV